MQPKINIKVDSAECMPIRAHKYDAGADLVAKRYTVLDRNIRTLVPTGVYTEIPEGFVGLLFPRSSLSKNKIVMTNSVGVIDSEYRGEILASLMYIGDRDFEVIEQYTRIVQLVVVPVLLPEFNTVDELTDTFRGSGGFGSTGTT